MNDETQLVVILDPRGIITSDAETLSRHVLYGNELRVIDPKKRLVIFTSTKNVNQISIPADVDLFQIKAGRIPIGFSSTIAKFIKTQYVKNEMVFVVGDPWESFLAYKLIAFRTGKRYPLQVQIHSELANPDWYLDRIPNYLKFLVSSFGLNQSNQIRTVSKLQQSDISLKFKLPSKKFKQIPPLLNIKSNFHHKDDFRPRSIGFVCRIAKDRGTREFIQFCKKLNKADGSFKVEVAGTGPDLKNLERKLLKILGKNRVHFHGHLDSYKLSGLWERVGVLISLSKTESYGRTIREAAFSGVPVWSRETSGFEELREELNESVTEVYRTEMSPLELLATFNSLLFSTPPAYSGEEITELNEVRIVKLCESWLALFEKSSN